MSKAQKRVQWTQYNIPIFVVSMPNSGPRRDAMTEQLKQQQLPFRFIPGVMVPGDVTEHAMTALRRRVADCGAKPLTAPEEGIFLAHTRALAQLVREGCDGAVIMEDDVKLRPEFRGALQELHPAHPPQWFTHYEFDPDNVVSRLTYWKSRRGARLKTGPVISTCALSWGGGTAAYWVDRRSALLYLAAFQSLSAPIDMMYLDRQLAPQWVWVPRPRTAPALHPYESPTSAATEARKSTGRDPHARLGILRAAGTALVAAALWALPTPTPGTRKESVMKRRGPLGFLRHYARERAQDQRPLTRFSCGAKAPIYIAGDVPSMPEWVKTSGSRVMVAPQSVALPPELIDHEMGHLAWGEWPDVTKRRAAAHLWCIARIAREQAQGAIVMEPHAAPHSDFAALSEVLHHRGHHFPLLQLVKIFPKAGGPLGSPVFSRRNVRWALDAPRTCSLNMGQAPSAAAYWISRDYAKRLIRELVPLRAPIEWALFGNPWAVRPHWAIDAGPSPVSVQGVDPGAITCDSGQGRLAALRRVELSWRHVSDDDAKTRWVRPQRFPLRPQFAATWLRRFRGPAPVAEMGTQQLMQALATLSPADQRDPIG